MKRNKIKVFKRIANAILRTLQDMKLINLGATINIEKINDDIYFSLKNANFKENELFKSSFSEFISVIDDPRYIIRVDKKYYQVPEIIGKNKENVESLLRHLALEKSEILYTKTPEGIRKLFFIKLQQSNLINEIEVSKEKEESDYDDYDVIVDMKVMKDMLNS